MLVSAMVHDCTTTVVITNTATTITMVTTTAKPLIYSVLWTMRFEMRGSILVRAVPPRSRWLLYPTLIWWYSIEVRDVTPPPVDDLLYDPHSLIIVMCLLYGYRTTGMYPSSWVCCSVISRPVSLLRSGILLALLTQRSERHYGRPVSFWPMDGSQLAHGKWCIKYSSSGCSNI